MGSPTDTERILEALHATPGQWVADLYGLTHAMVHSRVADLRRQGHLIECRMFGRGDYRYRLIPRAPQDAAHESDWPADPAHYDEREMIG